jgi:hypothetical protein
MKCAQRNFVSDLLLLGGNPLTVETIKIFVMIMLMKRLNKTKVDLNEIYIKASIVVLLLSFMAEVPWQSPMQPLR